MRLKGTPNTEVSFEAFCSMGEQRMAQELGKA